MTTASDTAEPRRVRFPTAFTILFGLIVVVAGLTWVIPAGQYERVQNAALNREVPVAGTYAVTEAAPGSADGGVTTTDAVMSSSVCSFTAGAKSGRRLNRR